MVRTHEEAKSALDGAQRRRTRAVKARRPMLELSMAVLTAPVTLSDGRTLAVGSRGAIVFVYERGGAYEVEFSTPFQAVVTIEGRYLKEAPLA